MNEPFGTTCAKDVGYYEIIRMSLTWPATLQNCVSGSVGVIEGDARLNLQNAPERRLRINYLRRFSLRCNSRPDIAAPGVAIKTSVPVVRAQPWGFFDGTSLAATHVSGAIALLLSATNIRDRVCGRDRAFLIHDLITCSVEELGESGQDARFGFGRIDVLRVIGLAYECGYRPGGQGILYTHSRS